MVSTDTQGNVVSLPYSWGGLVNGSILTNGHVHDHLWGGLKIKALACRAGKAPFSQTPKARIAE